MGSEYLECMHRCLEEKDPDRAVACLAQCTRIRVSLPEMRRPKVATPVPG